MIINFEVTCNDWCICEKLECNEKGPFRAITGFGDGFRIWSWGTPTLRGTKRGEVIDVKPNSTERPGTGLSVSRKRR